MNEIINNTPENNQENEILCFSSFDGPINNKKSKGTVTLAGLHGQITGNKYRIQIEEIRNEQDPAKQAKLKSRLDYVTPSVICTERDRSKITAYSNVACIDLDGKDNPHHTPQQMHEILVNDPYLLPQLTYVSPKGNGLKLFLRYDAATMDVADCVHAVMHYLWITYSLTADKACIDPARACFLSYDPNAYFNPSAPICKLDFRLWLMRYDAVHNPSHKVKTPPPTNAEMYGTGENALARALIVSRRINCDITRNDYSTFFRLCMSLTALGEQGRGIFMHCCSFYANKQTVNLDEYFDKCMHDSHGEVTIGTFFEMARDAGIDISMPAPKREAESAEVDEPETIEQLPSFPEWIYDRLPPLLQKITSHCDAPAGKSMMLMTGITTVSAALPHYYMIYGGDKMEANLFFFGLAKSGSGKGLMKYCLRLVQPIHDKLIEESKTAIREHLIRMEQKKKKKGKRGEESVVVDEPCPPYKLFILPAESSSAAFIKSLYENGGRGIMFETEGDTLANIFSKDYGSYSDKYRKIPHHESLRFNRVGNSSSTMNEKGEGTYFEIEHPCMSTVMSGTLNQLKNLIPSPENGLFSRFFFLYMSTENKWQNQYKVNAGESFADKFDEYAKDLYVIYTALDCKGEEGVRFYLSDQQEEKVYEFFCNLSVQYHTLYGGDYDGTMRRLGLMHGRICMILTALRTKSVSDFDSPLYCSDEDLNISLEMIKVMNQHTTYAFQYLAPEKSKTTGLRNMPPQFQFYYALPKIFTATEALDIGLAMKFCKTTIYKYIRQFQNGQDGVGHLIEKHNRGTYRKVLNQ
jgi:hypothetical protein